MVMSLFLLTLETLLSLGIPVVICGLALRRLLISRSFNRVLYGLTAILTGATVLGLADPERLPGIVQSAAPLYAFACLALWVTVTTLSPSTRSPPIDM